MIQNEAIERVVRGDAVTLRVPVDAVDAITVWPLPGSTRWGWLVRNSTGAPVAEGTADDESQARTAARNAFDELSEETTEIVTPEDRRKLIEKRLRQVLQGLRPAEAEAIRQGYLKASAGLWELQSALSAHSDGPLEMELGSVKAARAIFDLLHLGNIV